MRQARDWAVETQTRHCLQESDMQAESWETINKQKEEIVVGL